ncbi:MAG: HNH endonuclease signature motif containing protein [Emcibacteraceae bacterium]|nr:HNH endonuclease signature motif containing protein [Emcibacteraceae bacterium]MDG1859414.1 HNH endonuclease signature motif containing protein [Emcibacteraceae bacterium]
MPGFDVNTTGRPSFKPLTKEFMFRMEGDGSAYITSEPIAGRSMFRMYECASCELVFPEMAMDIDHKIKWRRYLQLKGVKNQQEAFEAYNDHRNLRLLCRTCNSDHISSHLDEEKCNLRETRNDRRFIDKSDVDEGNPEDYNLPESAFRKRKNDDDGSEVKPEPKSQKRRITPEKVDDASNANRASEASDASRAGSASSSSTASVAEDASEGEGVFEIVEVAADVAALAVL